MSAREPGGTFYGAPTKEQGERLRQLACRALRRWPGTYTEIRLVKIRENAVFSAVRNDGQRVAVRVHRFDYHSDAALGSELTWLKALGQAGICVPSVLLSLDARPFEVVEHPDVPEARQVDVLEWFDGVPIGTIEGGVSGDREKLVEMFRTIGVIAASTHNHAEGWLAPPDFMRSSWDEEGLLGERSIWGPFWTNPALTAEQFQLLERVKPELRADLADFGKGRDRYGLIHGDMVPENLLSDGLNTMLIDFDDLGFGWHMFELATVLFWRQKDIDYPVLEASLFKGYRSGRELSDSQARTLPMFLLLRGLSYLSWVTSRTETDTAREQSPVVISLVCDLAQAYLDAKNPKTLCRP